MSDESGSDDDAGDEITLDQIQEDFYKEVGHRPHSVKQMLAYCQQKGTGKKFKDVKEWWPTRPNPEDKPKQEAINANDYLELTLIISIYL